jgi:hypothetical protein
MIGVYPTFHLTPVIGLVVFVFGASPVGGQELSRRFPVTWSTGEPGLLDRGTGIAFLANQPGYGTVEAETVLVRARPTSSAEITGAFLYQEMRKGIAWRYGVAAPRRLRPNVLEYGYEMSGVPIDRLTPGERWARVILGFDMKDQPYLGWVALDSTRVRYLLWKKVLAGNPVFFLPEEPPRFHDQPGGKEVPLGTRLGDNRDYIMHPLETQGPWLRVRVAQPADICGGPDHGRVRNTVAWIRYLTPTGRPKVWFYTRGC